MTLKRRYLEKILWIKCIIISKASAVYTDSNTTTLIYLSVVKLALEEMQLSARYLSKPLYSTILKTLTLERMYN